MQVSARNSNSRAARSARVAGTAAVLATFLAMAPAGADAADPAKPTSARPVQVVKVATSAGSAVRSFTGTVRARVESDIGFRVAGKIAARLVDVGARVAAGQVLAELDATDYRLALQGAEADLSAAAAAAKQAEADERRYRELLRDGHVSQADYDRRKAAADSATERRVAAERQRDLARNRLAYTAVKADAAGIVTDVRAEAGQVVEAGRPVFRIARTGEVEAVVAVPEGQLDLLKGASAEVSFWSAPDQRVPATLREVAPEADPVTRTHAVRFTLPTDRAAALGTTATVHIGRPGARAIRLPRSAVVNFGKGPQVWTVADGGKLTAVPVTLGTMDDDTVAVSGGLKDGDMVVSIGAHRLDGTEAVRIAEVRP